MTDPTITCPSCKNEIKLTESLAAPLLESTRQQFQRQLAEKDQNVAEREAAIKQQQQDVLKAQAGIDEQIAEKLRSERVTIAIEEARKAKQLLGADLEQKGKEVTDLQEVLKQREEKLAEAQKAQAQVLKMQRDLEDAKREIDLTVEKRIQEGLAVTREQAKKEAEDELKLKVAEKELTIPSMQKQIEDLKRKAEQGSQQTQGETLELVIEEVLRSAFPHDRVEPVPKGMHGGDLLHFVHDPTGVECGRILWEAKRTKNWSDTWLPQLRDDQRAAKAQFAVLASIELPKGCSTFTHVEGIWVTNRACLLGVATALRTGLIDVAQAKRSVDGRHGKMELIYSYLAGPEFRHRVEGIVEGFVALKTDLEAEKKAMQRIWAKREKQIDRAINSAAGMHGDLSGIVGAVMPAIESLDLLAIAAPENSSIDEDSQ